MKSMKQDLIRKLSRHLNTPEKVQKYLHSFEYNKGETMYSAFTAIKKQKAHCLEGVFVAASLLEYSGYEPYVLSLESQDRLDHCLFIFQENGLWGSIGKSRDRGLGGRTPRYRSVKDLVWSYFDPYIDKTGKITAWQVAHLDEIECDWRYSSRNVWELENHLLEIKHHKLKSSIHRYKKNLKRYLKSGDLPLHKHWR
jgi:hypothetical protein